MNNLQSNTVFPTNPDSTSNLRTHQEDIIFLLTRRHKGQPGEAVINDLCNHLRQMSTAEFQKFLLSALLWQWLDSTISRI